MAGPIRNLVRKFRENRPVRQQRRRERRAAIRELLSPLSAIDNADRLQSVSVNRRPTKLFRSIGAGTSNQQVLGRNPVPMPRERKMQDKPDGPDIGKDSGQRPYDGDGLGKPYDAKTPKAETIPSPKQPRFTTTASDNTPGKIATASEERLPPRESGTSLPSVPTQQPDQIGALRAQVMSIEPPENATPEQLKEYALRLRALTNKYTLARTEAEQERLRKIAEEERARKANEADPLYVANQSMGLGRETANWSQALARSAAPDSYGANNPYFGDVKQQMLAEFGQQLVSQYRKTALGEQTPFNSANVVSSVRSFFPPEKGEDRQKYVNRVSDLLYRTMSITDKGKQVFALEELRNHAGAWAMQLASQAADFSGLKEYQGMWGASPYKNPVTTQPADLTGYE